MSDLTYIIAAAAARYNNVDATLLTLKFGSASDNDLKVKDAKAQLDEMALGGNLVLLNGPASLPVACTIAHAVCHLFGGVAVFDPKMAGYVVAISHGDKFTVGQVIPASEVVTEG